MADALRHLPKHSIENLVGEVNRLLDGLPGRHHAATTDSEVVVIDSRTFAVGTPIVCVAALGRLAEWQMHGVLYLSDDLSVTPDALVGEKIKTLLPPLKDDTSPWRSPVLNIGWHCTRVLKIRPVIVVSGRMRQGSAVGFRL